MKIEIKDDSVKITPAWYEIDYWAIIIRNIRKFLLKKDTN